VVVRSGFHVALCASIAAAVPVAAWLTGADARLVGMIVGAAALCTLSYQLLDTWHMTTLLAKVLVVALILSILMSLIAQVQLRHNVVLVTVVTYPLIAHRVGCIMIGLYWRWLLHFDMERSRHRLVSGDTGDQKTLD
jgi:hypothetical protein